MCLFSQTEEHVVEPEQLQNKCLFTCVHAYFQLFSPPSSYLHQICITSCNRCEQSSRKWDMSSNVERITKACSLWEDTAVSVVFVLSAVCVCVLVPTEDVTWLAAATGSLLCAWEEDWSLSFSWMPPDPVPIWVCAYLLYVSQECATDSYIYNPKCAWLW